METKYVMMIVTKKVCGLFLFLWLGRDVTQVIEKYNPTN